MHLFMVSVFRVDGNDRVYRHYFVEARSPKEAREVDHPMMMKRAEFEEIYSTRGIRMFSWSVFKEDAQRGLQILKDKAPNWMDVLVTAFAYGFALALEDECDQKPLYDSVANVLSVKTLLADRYVREFLLCIAEQGFDARWFSGSPHEDLGS